MLRVPSVSSTDHYEPLPIHPEYSPYDPVDRNATNLPANLVSSELSRDILVQPCGKDNPGEGIYSLNDFAI